MLIHCMSRVFLNFHNFNASTQHFRVLTAPFNNMRTLKFKAQPTNSFFATVNQMFAGSSQLSTAAERAVIKSLCRVQTTNRVVSWEDPPNTWLTAAKNAFVGWAFNFRVRVLLKSAVKTILTLIPKHNNDSQITAPKLVNLKRIPYH